MARKKRQSKKCPVGAGRREETGLKRCSGDQHVDGAAEEDAKSNHQNKEADTSLRRCSAGQHAEGAAQEDAISNHQNNEADTSLRRCSAGQHAEGAAQEDAISNHQNKEKTDTSLENKKMKGKLDPNMKCPVKTSTSGDDSKPKTVDGGGYESLRTKQMFESLHKGYSVMRVLSPRAASLYRNGMLLSEVVNRLGVRDAFTYGPSIYVTLKLENGDIAISESPPPRKRSSKKIIQELRRRGYRRLAPSGRKRSLKEIIEEAKRQGYTRVA